jgi:2-(1,2-epoxy-1,2-dihydrophenyl)acetyl-CoA isomerase
MSQSDAIVYEEVDSVGLVRINREEKKNALDARTLKAMGEALDRAEASREVRVVVVTGTGRSFCAGADLGARDTPASAVEVIETLYKPVFMRIAELSKPVIAAIDGAAAGAGSALAMVCDLSVMRRDAYLLFAFSNLGLIPDCGANWLLERAIGRQRAYRLAIEGGRLSAEECLALGLTNKLSKEDALADALAWAQELSARAPLSLGLTKKIMRQCPVSSYSDIVSVEGELQQQCMQSADFRQGVTAFFEKRQPAFSGA